MICIGSDQAGFPMKEMLRTYLAKKGFEVSDKGTFDTQPVDYPDYAARVADEVASGKAEFGIVVCGTGIGISMAANKIHGIRAALCTNTTMARLAREHNDANVLTMGARIIGDELARDIADAFLSAAFDGDRHTARVEKIMALENRPSGE